MAARKRNQKPAGQKLKSAEQSVERAFTVLWEELPLWQQDNHYILSGYRPEFRSFKKCFISLGYLHNETANIYTHLLPALSVPYAALLLYTLHTPLLSSTLLTLGTFLTAATTCLGMSATYHTISCHSHAIAQAGNRLDYLGIVILIVGSFMPSVYYGFYCDRRLVWGYWTMMLTLALFCTLVSTLPTFRTPSWRPFRAAMFVALGGSSVLPVLHGLARYGYEELEERMGLSWMLLEGALYVAGAGIYAARVPEKWAPGTFDIWGSSHQIFHVMVVVAAAAHGVGLVKSVRWLEGRVMVGGVEGVCF